MRFLLRALGELMITTGTVIPLFAAYELWGTGLAATGYVRLVRTSSRVAFDFAWSAYTLTVLLPWRKVLAVPDGRGRNGTSGASAFWRRHTWHD